MGLLNWHHSFPKISIKGGHTGDLDVKELKLSWPESKIIGFSFVAIIISKKGIETDEKIWRKDITVWREWGFIKSLKQEIELSIIIVIR